MKVSIVKECQGTASEVWSLFKKTNHGQMSQNKIEAQRCQTWNLQPKWNLTRDVFKRAESNTDSKYSSMEKNIPQQKNQSVMIVVHILYLSSHIAQCITEAWTFFYFVPNIFIVTCEEHN